MPGIDPPPKLVVLQQAAQWAACCRRAGQYIRLDQNAQSTTGFTIHISIGIYKLNAVSFCVKNDFE
jgi:hypothetical protein